MSTASDALKEARRVAARTMLSQAAEKVTRWEHRLTDRTLSADERRKLVAELDLWKKINEMAAREVKRWTPAP